MEQQQQTTDEAEQGQSLGDEDPSRPGRPSDPAEGSDDPAYTGEDDLAQGDGDGVFRGAAEENTDVPITDTDIETSERPASTT